MGTDLAMKEPNGPPIVVRPADREDEAVSTSAACGSSDGARAAAASRSARGGGRRGIAVGSAVGSGEAVAVGSGAPPVPTRVAETSATTTVVPAGKPS